MYPMSKRCQSISVIDRSERELVETCSYRVVGRLEDCRSRLLYKLTTMNDSITFAFLSKRLNDARIETLAVLEVDVLTGPLGSAQLKTILAM